MYVYLHLNVLQLAYSRIQMQLRLQHISNEEVHNQMDIATSIIGSDTVYIVGKI